MNPKQLQLALEKQRLLLQSAAQRDALAAAAAGVAPLLAAADTVREGVRWVARNRLSVASFIAAFLIARPRNLARWARRGMVAWQVWRRVRQWRVDSVGN